MFEKKQTAAPIYATIRTLAPEPFHLRGGFPNVAIEVCITQQGKDYYATWFEGKLTAVASSPQAAYNALKELIIITYEACDGSTKSMGESLAKQWAVLRQYISRAQI